MIADLRFEPADPWGVRRARFIPRSSIPLGAACLVANSLRETLRELLGERCEVTLGEPAAIDAHAWAALSRDAYCFLACGRQTDIVLVLPQGAARTLVLRAFGESDTLGATPLSMLELEAVERIVARCVPAFDPLCAERRGTVARVSATALPAGVAYFDVRVRAPIAIALGVAILRDLPDPGPTGSLAPASLARVPLGLRVEIATGTVELADMLNLAPGDVVELETKVGSPATLKIGYQAFASGKGGVSDGRYSFEVHALQRFMGAGS